MANEQNKPDMTDWDSITGDPNEVTYTELRKGTAEKVYCKNCKWYQKRFFFHDLQDCVVIEEYILPNGKKQECWGYTSQLNRNYDCKDYKRKWWKFWARNN